LEDHTTLGVAEEGPGDVAVLELVNGYLTSESAVRLVEDVLRCDLKTGFEVLASKEKVERWWCNNNLCGSKLS
jgi:hypothetical protein